MPKKRNSPVSKPVNPTTPNLKQSRRTARDLKSGVAAPALPAAAHVEVDPQLDESIEEEEVVLVVKKRARRAAKTAAASNGTAATGKPETTTLVPEVVEEEEEVITKKKTVRRRQPDPLPCIDPTPELLSSLQASNYTPPPRPVPTLGYACLCMALRELSPPIFTSRDCIKKTLDSKGLPYLGELCLANCKDLARVIQWNQEHGIRLFRMSSVLWPWMGTFNPKDLPQYEEISAALKFAGDLARMYDQRVTFHPSHFVKLAAPDKALVAKSIAELEGHSQILDLMGYPPSCENKINIHVGGVYSAIGDKTETMQRWADNYKRLSPNCQARMTVENDDVASAFSTEDLLQLHEMCDKKLPIVFDFHHHKFCPGSFTEREALEAALATWPRGVKPIVHWSESQPGRKPHAHSDYVKGPIYLHGYEGAVEVMIEAKCKERALLAYRDGLPIPEVGGSGGEKEEGGDE